MIVGWYFDTERKVLFVDEQTVLDHIVISLTSFQRMERRRVHCFDTFDDDFVIGVLINTCTTGTLVVVTELSILVVVRLVFVLTLEESSSVSTSIQEILHVFQIVIPVINNNQIAIPVTLADC